MVRDGDTVASFPTYADLTQTQGWTHAASTPVRAALERATTETDPELARYTEGALLGVGGMGKVVLAHDKRIGREVAVKQLHTDRELAPGDRLRFMREARVQGQLEHPSIVPVYDIDERPDGTTFFTMRRVLGRTLATIIDELRAGDAAARARFTLRELLQAFATVCLTIDYAHSRGVIHRDVKPANIMLGDFGEVYVLDWGLARIVDEPSAAPLADPTVRLSLTGELMGTPLYMAPEQMGTPDVGPAADVFSLGAILFELLTLARLRDATTLYTPAEARPSVRAPDLQIAPELEAICVRATQSDPAERYPSARALQDAVVRYLEGDRDTAMRRTLANQHASAARSALARAEAPGADYEAQRGEAMRELMRSIALDPQGTEHVGMLAGLIDTPPRTLPREVAREMSEAEQAIVRSGARHSVGASLCWFAFLPLVLLMGLREPMYAALVLAPTTVVTILAAIAARARYITYWMQIVVFGGTLVAAAFTSTMYGPLVMLPTLTATFAIVIQSHPQRVMRNLTLVLSAVALMVPAVLELAGVTSAYRFEHGNLVIVPRMHELPRTLTIIALLTASLAMTIVPCFFISRLRGMLSELQLQLLVRAWHFRRLGQELIDASPRPQ